MAGLEEWDSKSWTQQYSLLNRKGESVKNLRIETPPADNDCLFKKKDPWGHGFALWVMAFLVFLAPLAISTLKSIRMDNRVDNWLPKNDPSAEEYIWCRDHFPEQEQVLLTWEGSSIDDPRLPILLGTLLGTTDADGVRRGGLPYVDSVLHAGHAVSKMTDHGIEQQEAIQRLEGTMIGRGRMKLQLTEAGLADLEQTKSQLLQHMQKEFGLTITFHDPVTRWEPAAPQAETFEALCERYDAEYGIGDMEVPELPVHHLQLTWDGMQNSGDLVDRVRESLVTVTSDGNDLVQSCGMASGSPITLMVSLTEAGVSDPKACIQSLRTAATNCFIQPDALLMGGGILGGVELNNGVIKAAWNPEAPFYLRSVILLSGLVGIIFALYSLKSLRLGVLVIGVSYYAALLGVAMIPVTGGSMNMVLIVLPTLLMVLALSGAIHVANYWKHAVSEYPKEAVSRAAQMARVPCSMAALTTALGLISLGGSPLIPVKMFGIYAAVGCIISLGMVLYGLPALLCVFPIKVPEAKELNPKFWNDFGRIVCNHWKLTAVASIAIALVCSAGLYRFQVETKVIKYFQDDSRIVQDYRNIENTLAGVASVEILVKFDETAQDETRFLDRIELVRKVKDELAKHPEVSGAVTLADFQPVREAPGDDASTRTKIFFNRRSQQTERKIKDGEFAGTEDFLAMEQASDLDQEATEIWRINVQTSVMSDANYDQLTDELGVAVNSVTKDLPGVEYVVTGTVPLFLRTQRAVLESLIWSSLTAFGLIAVVMIYVLRDPVAGMVSMIPNVLPVMAIFGLVSWFDQRIDIGTMVTASVAMGIAVDGTLHLLTWFRDGLMDGKTRKESVMLALSHCGPAMWQTSAAVGIGLLVLLPAELLLVSRFGWLMASLIGAALVADLVLLPSLLMGPLGYLVERKVVKKSKGEPDEPSSSGIVPAHHFPLESLHTPRAVG